MRIRDNDYELTPEFYKSLSYTGYTGRTLKNENDILMMNNVINDLGYTGIVELLIEIPKERHFFLQKIIQN